MVPPKVSARHLIALIVTSSLCLGVAAGKVPAAELLGFGDCRSCRGATSDCQCQKCNCDGRTGKDNVFQKGMRFFIGHFQAMLPSKTSCDETPCDDACDAMMIEELMELRDAGDSDPPPSASDSLTNELRQINVDSLSETTGTQVIKVRQKFPDAVEPSDHLLEDIPRGRLRLSTPRTTVPVPAAPAKTTLIPNPIRNAKPISSTD